MNIYFYFIVIILLALCILGLQTKSTELSSDIRKESIENFQTSSSNQINNGASTFYDWGLIGQNNREILDDSEEQDMISEEVCSGKKKKVKPEKCSSCNSGKTSVENNYYIYQKNRPSPCDKCDITRHPDINKYVLKSSVPACPDMSKYAPKTMLNNLPDMREYIKKSEIPPCPPKVDLSNYIKKSEIPSCPSTPDMSKYVLKSSIPATPKCPTCPICPLCPVCPPSYKHVENDPRFKEWIIKYKEEQSKILHREFIRRDTCEKENRADYTKGYKSGKDSAYKELSSELGSEVKDLLKKDNCKNVGDYKELLGKYEEMKKENENLLRQINKRKRQTEIIIKNRMNSAQKPNNTIYNNLKQEQEEQARIQEEQRRTMGGLFVTSNKAKQDNQKKTMGGLFVSSNKQIPMQKKQVNQVISEENCNNDYLNMSCNRGEGYFLGNNGRYNFNS